jgi:tricorn protease
VVVLPPKAGRYDSLAVVSGKLLYRRLPRTGSGEEKSPVVFYDLEKREEKTVIEDADFAELSADRQKLLVREGNDYGIIGSKEGQKLDKKIKTGGFEGRLTRWRSGRSSPMLAAAARLFLRPGHARR